jgi:hypothetical protein
MNFWEQFVIHLALGIVQGIVKNPQHAAALRSRLLEVADAIYEAYGLTPPAHD